MGDTLVTKPCYATLVTSYAERGKPLRSSKGREEGMRRALLLLVVAAALLAVVAGAVLAEDKTCTPGDCIGTRGADTLTGQFNTLGINRIAGLEGNDTINGGDSSDIIYGDEGNDTINDGDDPNESDSDTIYGDEGNDTIDVHENNLAGADTVNCGPGTKDKVSFDQGIDKISRNCEIRNP